MLENGIRGSHVSSCAGLVPACMRRKFMLENGIRGSNS
jgi:hypothetical protein